MLHFEAAGLSKVTSIELRSVSTLRSFLINRLNPAIFLFLRTNIVIGFIFAAVLFFGRFNQVLELWLKSWLELLQA